MSRPDWLPSSTVSVNLHVFETTAYRVSFYPAEDRVTVDADGSGGSVVLFLDRPEIARLRGVLEQAERELTARQNTENGPRVVRGPAA
ncbi:hypothetical protein H7X46_24195 [Pseudonocardia sp. C8]|uniref:hypothetical protein n=1 Tax=Pseudonocardia sp. C8 TaxID=2762759 RepID=UPI0016429452|nr:hypothetical protein [Pseudonocardia sp. C8]MBC3194158.1 hypothetical protein [Pseudonocardia sp. C8]